MSTLSKFQRIRASSKTIKEDSTIINLEITARKIQKPHSNPWRKNFLQKQSLRRFMRNLPKTLEKMCPQQKPVHPEIRQNRCISRMTKEPVNQFATQINWLVSIRDELLPKGISKQTEFCFTVSEQDLVDNRSINKWQVTCSMYDLFDRCVLCKVYVGCFLDTKI